MESKAIDILVKVVQIDSNEYDEACHVLIVQISKHLKEVENKNKKNLTIQQHIASICNYTFHISIQSLVYI